MSKKKKKMGTRHSVKKFTSESELRDLWENKNKRYEIESCIGKDGCITHLVLEDKCDGGTVIGKLVNKSSEEFRQAPWLHHRNLASLIDMVTIHETVCVFVSVLQEKSLTEVINDDKFIWSPNCLALKKLYVKDVLLGLAYLHKNGLCLMNLTADNVIVCEQSNKAVITNFSCLTRVNTDGQKVNNEEHKFATDSIQSPVFSKWCDLRAVEMRMTGLMVMEVFTQRVPPSDSMVYDPNQWKKMIDNVDCELLKEANIGSTFSFQDLLKFKDFVGKFVNVDPKRRHSAGEAALATFLHNSEVDGLNLQKLAICSNDCSSENKKSEEKCRIDSIQKDNCLSVNDDDTGRKKKSKKKKNMI